MESTSDHSEVTTPLFDPLKHHNITRIVLNDKEIFLVGTAHVSLESVKLVEQTVAAVKPDSIAVELCDSRLQSLKDPDRWKNTDIFAIIKEGKVFLLFAQLILASFQKKLGEQLKVKPGAEMMRAVELAEESGAELVLADREVRTTLKRVWASLGFWKGMKVLIALLGSIISNEKIDQEEIERMKQADALDELMAEFTKALPQVRRTLIDERDQFLASKIASSKGKVIVAVVGAGHVPGIKKWINESIDLEALNEIPKKFSPVKIIAWLIPIAVAGLIIYGFYSAGSDKGIEMAATWFWINAILGGFGAACALAHPLTILTAFLVSPFTSLNPLIAGGWVAGLSETILRKPKVADFEAISDDLSSITGLWKNRVTRIILVVALTNGFGTLGTLIGIERLGSLLS